MKYTEFGRRMAGNVSLWQAVIPVVHNAEPHMTLTNLVDPNGPLALELHNFMMSNLYNHAYGTTIRAIGFFIDIQTSTNTLFKIFGSSWYGGDSKYSCK